MAHLIINTWATKKLKFIVWCPLSQSHLTSFRLTSFLTMPIQQQPSTIPLSWVSVIEVRMLAFLDSSTKSAKIFCAKAILKKSPKSEGGFVGWENGYLGVSPWNTSLQVMICRLVRRVQGWISRHVAHMSSSLIHSPIHPSIKEILWYLCTLHVPPTTHPRPTKKQLKH